MLFRAAILISLLASPAAAQPQFEDLLKKRHLPRFDDLTTAVASGDLDGDGDVDVVFGGRDSWPASNRLYLNDGTGILVDASAGRLPPSNHPTNALALGDVDSDGDLDLVLAIKTNQNRLFLNDGAGSFVDATATHMPAESILIDSRAVALGDVDGDGDLDLVFGNGAGYGAEQDYLYLNDGAGGFVDATATQMPATREPTESIVLADVDGDSDLDLVSKSGIYAPHLRLLRNDGGGTFSDATSSIQPAIWFRTNDIAVGDVDGDGDNDLVTARWGQNGLYLNDGSGAFTEVGAGPLPASIENTIHVTMSDVEGDGDLDLIFGNNRSTELYLNDGTGHFGDVTAAQMPNSSATTRKMIVVDIDNDADLDLVGAGGQNRLLLNDGTGLFVDATAKFLEGSATGFWELVDVDGDDDTDLIGLGSQTRLYLNDGTGSYVDATGQLPYSSYQAANVAHGDVDGDGDPDLIFAVDGLQNRLYLNDGTGTFENATASNLPIDTNDSRDVALADVDADGDLDALFANGGLQPNLLYENDGTGRFRDVSPWRMPTHFEDSQQFRDALQAVFIDLAQQIIKDGEGASKFVSVVVEGGRDSRECLSVAYIVAESPLVKTALFASDPNWGRILAAVGRAGVDALAVNGVQIYLDDVLIADRGGRAAGYSGRAGAGCDG